MKTLYQAANAVEAHMLVDLLKQAGINTAYIHGEHLQGAIGELPAAGLIRLVVDEADHDAARAVIDQWEIRNPAEPAAAPAQKPKSSATRGLLLGLAVGIAGSIFFFRVPMSTDGIDFNRDGVLDEKWFFSSSATIVKSEVDRNLDGKADYITRFDRRGLIESAEADDNFDGVFETHYAFRWGNAERSEVDTDGDGYRDLVTHFESGVASSSEFLDPSSGRPLRVEHYRLGIKLRAEVDTDKDGVLDTRQHYSRLGELLSTEKITR